MNVIFSIYVKPSKKDLEREKDKWSLGSFEKYSKKLLKCKKDYAKKVSADFKFFSSIKEIQEFAKKFRIDNIYNAINLYKIYMFEKLSEEYDQVLYLDFDVVVDTDLDFFKEVDLREKIWAIPQQDLVNMRNWVRFKNPRNPTLKYLHAKALLDGKENSIINTAIMGGSRDVIKRIGFTEKLPRYIKKTRFFQQGNGYIRKLNVDGSIINHNNEAFFSAAIVESGVEIQYEDMGWHTRLDDRTVFDPTTNRRNDIEKVFAEGKFIHFINKNFNSFYRDDKNVVYSMNVPIPKDLLVPNGKYHGDNIDKTERTSIEFRKWNDKLLANKQLYADRIGAKFIHFEDDDRWQDFRKWIKSLDERISEYDVVNFYKIWLLYELKKEGYDNMLYLDHDVVVNTRVNFFDAFNLSNTVACNFSPELRDDATPQAMEIMAKGIKDTYVYNFRSHEAKYWNAHAMLSEDDLEGKNDVYNTGIVGASSTTLDRLNYFDNFQEIIDTMTFLKEDTASMYIPAIQKSFGYDNETVFSYRVITNEVPVTNLNALFWHYKLDHTQRNKEYAMKQNPALFHVINKQFDWVKDILDGNERQ